MTKLVPFNSGWAENSRLDLKAIYRRPRWTKNEFDEDVQERDVNGRPLWDITTPLRVLDHNKWIAKGFEYITLATRDDLIKAYKAGTVQGDWRQYNQHQTGGPWNHKMYEAGRVQGEADGLDALRDQVDQFGPDAVEAIRRTVDPGFVLPPHLRAPVASSVAEGAPVVSSGVPERKKPGPKPKPKSEAE